MISITVVAMAASAFNLSCPVHFVQKAGTSTPFTADYVKTLRIDLDAERWCEDECTETKSVYASTREAIVLETELDEQIDAYSSFIINRETGALTNLSRIDAVSSQETGMCALNPFTGFPQAKF